jgi:hypothetical protein
MTVITHARRKSNLSKMIDSAGGVSVGIAVANAQKNLDAKRDEAMLIVEREIAALEAVAAPGSTDETSARLEQIYAAATGVIDAAAPFALTDLCQAASGLCDLIDSVPKDQPFDWRIVTVHAQSLRLLQSLPIDAADDRSQVLENLKKVIDRKRGQTG